MNKRIRKKVHKRHLVDVVYGISISPAWRKKLFEADYGNEFLIACHTTSRNEIPEYLRKQLCRYKLRYRVSKVSIENASGREDYEIYTIFKFEADEFSDIYDFSANNPKVRAAP